MADRYADVIIDISHEKVDRPFQYKIPPELSEAVYPGVQVHVPFGKGNAERTGYVVGYIGRDRLSQRENKGNPVSGCQGYYGTE